MLLEIKAFAYIKSSLICSGCSSVFCSCVYLRIFSLIARSQQLLHFGSTLCCCCLLQFSLFFSAHLNSSMLNLWSCIMYGCLFLGLLIFLLHFSGIFFVLSSANTNTELIPEVRVCFDYLLCKVQIPAVNLLELYQV